MTERETSTPARRPLHAVGFFREFEDASGDEPSIADFVGGMQPDIKDRVIGYLRGGAVLLAYFNISDDVLDDARPPIGPLEIRSDGEWVWPSDLPYYVDRYGVGLPPEFLDHLAARGWQPPTEGELDSAELAARAGHRSSSDQEDLRR
jgi:hypothetical protein